MSTDATEPDEHYRTDCDHTIEPQLSLDRSRWQVSPAGAYPNDQAETVDMPGGGTLTMYFQRLPVTWDATAAPRRTAGPPAARLHECGRCGAAVADTGQHARWHVNART